MYQALIKKGRVQAVETPAPLVTPGAVLIQVVSSCISAGTEMHSVRGSGKSLIRRALDQPDNVIKVLKMAKEIGISKTIAKVKGHLDTGTPIGYSAAGVVLAVGEGVNDLRPGQKVAAAGAAYAHHAQFIDVPRNLVCPLPEGLDFRRASTVTIGSIAMQGLRRTAPALGEIVIVVGAGILGLLSVQLLKAAGARVVAVDLDDRRLDIARKLGAETVFKADDPELKNKMELHTEGRLADCVVFCAATDQADSLSNAFGLLRRKGRLIMVGVWGRELKREDIYAKELDFLISCSYGPGRYDPFYEEQGHDYPYAYVRWTENRNMAEFMRLIHTGVVNLEPLLEGNYKLEQVEEAFSSLNSVDKPLLVTLDYGPPPELKALSQAEAAAGRKVFLAKANPTASGRLSTALVGAGSYATAMHLPNMEISGLFKLSAICSRSGPKAKAIGAQYQAGYVTSDIEEVIADQDIKALIICTRHHLHGAQVLSALKAGKHVLVEKPLALTEDELAAIENFYAESGSEAPILCVGFNRRFSRYAQAVKKAIEGPVLLNYRMNAGLLPDDHWVHGPEGGGRIVGEGCHIIDLFRYLTGSPATAINVSGLHPGKPFRSADNKIITFEYADGSTAVLNYYAVGSGDLPKENLEVHWQGKTIIMENYQSLKGYGLQLPSVSDSKPDKGQKNLLTAFGRAALDGGSWPIALEELLETSRLAIQAQKES